MALGHFDLWLPRLIPTWPLIPAVGYALLWDYSNFFFFFFFFVDTGHSKQFDLWLTLDDLFMTFDLNNELRTGSFSNQFCWPLGQSLAIKFICIFFFFFDPSNKILFAFLDPIMKYTPVRDFPGEFGGCRAFFKGRLTSGWRLTFDRATTESCSLISGAHLSLLYQVPTWCIKALRNA